jgi:polyhydroxyalkanoate synthesis regulator phasin
MINFWERSFCFPLQKNAVDQSIGKAAINGGIAVEEFWRKARYLGLGMLDFTREKIEAVVEEMIKRGELSQPERGQAVEQITEQAQRDQAAFFDKIKYLIQQVISQMGLARAADLEALERRVAALEEQLGKLGGGQGSGTPGPHPQ